MNLNCPKCLDKFLEPKILPCCGKSLCNYCISIIQDRKKFKCFYCSKVYELPEELPLDEKLISELDAKLGMKESILSETAKNFKSLINIIQKNITQAEFEFKNGDYVINEYCSELKRQVQLAKELKIQAIERHKTG